MSTLHRRRDEAGVAAILFSVLLPTVLIGMAAIAVDIGMLYREAERVQRAADAAALSAVTWMPGNLAQATTTARRTAALNGYPVEDGTTVTVAQGDSTSQLRVTITTTVDHTFGAAIGSPTAQVSRAAVADYTAPAPMGSPCNTFGNEPLGATGATGVGQPTGTALPSSPFPNCSSNPQFWAAVEGPGTDKVQGDRYGTVPCPTAQGCAGGRNTEYRSEGYFFALRVEPAAVGTTMSVQVYDPAYIDTGVTCGSIEQRYVVARMSDYTPSGGTTRYGSSTSSFCSGDYNPRVTGDPVGEPLDTTFVVRGPTPTGDPLRSAVLAGCTRQFEGRRDTVRSEELRQWTQATGAKVAYAGFNSELSRVFHQWVELCTFTPTSSGNYYLQVRTNRSTAGGTPVANSNGFPVMVRKDNPSASERGGDVTTTTGLNSFALRMVPTSAGLRDDVAVAGYSRMPVLQNAPSSLARFNLIRALPSARGQYVAFDFYDAADGSTGSGGSVKVIAPADATGSIKSGPGGSVPGCRGSLGGAELTALSGCSVPVNSSTHNGKVQRMVIPLPADYNCNAGTLGGCWFQVEVDFSTTSVTDFTTWDANIAGDPVRLIE